MSGSSKRFHYTVARTAHWVAVYFIFFNLLFGWRLEGLSPSTKHLLLMLHSGAGTAVGFLMLFRWWWRRSHDLYAAPGWWKKPSMLLQVSFYPLLLIQAMIGVGLAAVIDYDVLAFGFINYSAIAPDNEWWRGVFLRAHGLTAALLILLVLIHALEPVSARDRS